jgi:hypothetical protein
MNDDRRGGISLIAGSAVMLVVMMFHPTGHSLSHAGESFRAVAMLNRAVHLTAILTMPLFFFGAVILTRRLVVRGWTAGLALIFYGFALIAGSLAATMSGLIAPETIARAAAATTPDAEKLWNTLLRYTGLLNQGFTQIFVIGAATAILLWSLALGGEPGLKWYGILSSLATVLVVAAGLLKLDVHGFGLVMIVQAVWLCVAGVRLMRGRWSE